MHVTFYVLLTPRRATATTVDIKGKLSKTRVRVARSLCDNPSIFVVPSTTRGIVRYTKWDQAMRRLYRVEYFCCSEWVIRS